MLATKNTHSYEWDLQKLRKAKVILFNKKDKTKEEIDELTYLDRFLSNSNLTFSNNTISDKEFSRLYHEDFINLFFNYYSYLSYIFEFYDFNTNNEIQEQYYEKIGFTEDDILSTVHDFYSGLDKEWFKFFNKIYKERTGLVKFDATRPYSIYFPVSDIWYANLTNTGNISDLVNATHEFGHGIADQIVGVTKGYSAQNIFIELFPMLCQMIFLHENDDLALQSEIAKYISNYHKLMIDYAEEIKFKYVIANKIPSVSNARNLSRLIKRNLHQSLSKQELINVYSNDIEDVISYVFPFIVCLELLEVYRNDKDLFKYKVNKILTSNDEPLKVLEKLNIEPNKVLR